MTQPARTSPSSPLALPVGANDKAQLHAASTQAEENLEIRIWGNATQPSLIYLPGLHGDWTLIRSFRKALGSQICFVEITYPRTLTWSLEEYAAAIEHALARQGIHSGWLLAESFGSQIGWHIASRQSFHASGLILAGGFVRHPRRWEVHAAYHVLRIISPRWIARLFAVYAACAKVRYRHAPEVLQDLAVFVSRRNDLDRRAAQHRLRLILESDLCRVAKDLKVPVYAVTGLLDAIVPWWPVRRWLARYCRTFQQHAIIWCADHSVLATAPQRSAKLILGWISTQANLRQSGQEQPST